MRTLKRSSASHTFASWVSKLISGGIFSHHVRPTVAEVRDVPTHKLQKSSGAFAPEEQEQRAKAWIDSSWLFTAKEPTVVSARLDLFLFCTR